MAAAAALFRRAGDKFRQAGDHEAARRNHEAAQALEDWRPDWPPPPKRWPPNTKAETAAYDQARRAARNRPTRLPPVVRPTGDCPPTIPHDWRPDPVAGGEFCARCGAGRAPSSLPLRDTQLLAARLEQLERIVARETER